MSELAAGSLGRHVVSRRVHQFSIDWVGHYSFVGNIEGYHCLGHRRIQHDMSGLSYLGESVRLGKAEKEKEKKSMEEPTIAQDVEFCHISTSGKPNMIRGGLTAKAAGGFPGKRYLESDPHLLQLNDFQHQFHRP